MSDVPKEDNLPVNPTPESVVGPALEQFLNAVERKTTDPIHLRLLKACRQGDPASAMESELRDIFAEITNAD